MSDLQPRQQRMIEELAQLSDRLAKLEMFLASPEFAHVPAAEQWLLREQAIHMTYYHRTLLKRIDAWPEPPEPTT